MKLRYLKIVKIIVIISTSGKELNVVSFLKSICDRMYIQNNVQVIYANLAC